VISYLVVKISRGSGIEPPPRAIISLVSKRPRRHLLTFVARTINQAELSLLPPLWP